MRCLILLMVCLTTSANVLAGWMVDQPAGGPLLPHHHPAGAGAGITGAGPRGSPLISSDGDSAFPVAPAQLLWRERRILC